MLIQLKSDFTNEFERVFTVTLSDVVMGRVTVEKTSARLEPIIYLYLNESLYSLEPKIKRDINDMGHSYSYGYNADGIHLGTVYNTSRSLGLLSFLNYTCVRLGPYTYTMYRNVTSKIEYIVMRKDHDNTESCIGYIVIDNKDLDDLAYSIYTPDEQFVDLLIMLTAHSYVWEIRGGYRLPVNKKASVQLDEYFTEANKKLCMR